MPYITFYHEFIYHFPVSIVKNQKGQTLIFVVLKVNMILTGWSLTGIKKDTSN